MIDVNIMVVWMGWFFIAVSTLKLLDLPGFAHAYSMYDIIGKRSKAYSYAYPFIEFLLGAAFLKVWNVKLLGAFTFILMTIGTIGVAKNLMSKNKVRCACLGTVIKIPLTKFTLVEDIVMGLMGLMIFFMI